MTVQERGKGVRTKLQLLEGGGKERNWAGFLFFKAWTEWAKGSEHAPSPLQNFNITDSKAIGERKALSCILAGV